MASAFGLHGLTSASENFAGKLAIKVAVHGAIGGGIAELQGGQFRHGLVAGAFTGGASPFIVGAGLPPAGQIAAAAVVGGTASELGGGKFSNGAVTAAFVYIFNQNVISAAQEAQAQRNPAAFYRAKIAEGGDGAAYAKLALDVVNNEGFEGQAANDHLRNFAALSGVKLSDDTIRSIQLDLMDAHAAALQSDTYGKIGVLSASQIESYHHAVYLRYGIGPMGFGGTFSDTIWPKGQWCPRCDSVP